MVKLSIIVPAHNEEKRIGKLLHSYLNFFRLMRKKGLDFEIIVVLNACTDNTRKVVESYKAREIRILDFKRGGKGFAVLEGFKDALKRHADYIGFVDADCATTPEAYHALYTSFGDADAVIASRYIKGSVMNPPPTIWRRFCSRAYNALIRALFLFSYRDTQCGAKIFTRETIKAIVGKIGMTRWAFDVELLFRARKEGFIIHEVPTVWSDKEYSKVNAARAGPMMLLGIIRLRLLNSPLRFLISVYDFIAGIANRILKK